MPGELGDETQQPMVGYYERHYPADSGPNVPMDPSVVKTGKKPKQSMIQRVLMRTRQIHKGVDDAKSKSGQG